MTSSLKNVFSKVLLGVARVSTVEALIRLRACVYSFVSSKIGCQSCLVAARLALVSFVSLVEPLMAFQLMSRFAAVTALVAQEASFGGMSLEMDGQFGLVSEEAGATEMRTFELLVVKLHVSR